MRTSEKTEIIAAALVKIQSEIEPAVKNAENPHFRSRFANLDAIWSVAAPVLTKNNVAVFQGGDLDGASGSVATLVTRLIHASGQWIEGRMPLVCEKANNPQALGSSITYLKRYGLAAALGITTIDDDAEGAMNRGGIVDQKMAASKPKLDDLPFGPDDFNPGSVTLGPRIPAKIKGIGGTLYSDHSIEELQTQATIITKGYEKGGWTLKGDVLEFVTHVEKMSSQR